MLDYNNAFNVLLSKNSMKCPKCSHESEGDSKFCSQCGAKLEEPSSVDNLIKNCQKIWYVLGFLRGISRNDKDKKWHNDFEKMIKKKMPEFYQEYEEVIQFWRDLATKNEQNKKPKQGNEQSPASAGNN